MEIFIFNLNPNFITVHKIRKSRIPTNSNFGTIHLEFGTICLEHGTIILEFGTIILEFSF